MFRDTPIHRGPAIYAALGSIALLVIGAQQAGPKGLLGVVVLVLACGFSVLSLAFIVKFVSQPEGSFAGRNGTLWALVMLVVKLPATLLGLWLAWVLLGGALLPFFGTIGLVYSATVWNLGFQQFRGNGTSKRTAFTDDAQ